MNIRSFVGASSSVLLAWLGATYFHEVPPERYPKQGHTSASTSQAEADECGIAKLDTIKR
jgi:CBS-domain-containing membrane protein